MLVTIPHLEAMVAAAFSVKEDAAIGCSRDCDAFAISAWRGAVRALASVGAATRTMITGKRDAILALLMPNPQKLQLPLEPHNHQVIIRTAGVVENASGRCGQSRTASGDPPP